jgi:ribosomal protein S18 acetylase RimI-like enzyme
MTFKISLGLPSDLRAEAAAVYWQAFGGKLGRVLGPDARAITFLQRALRSDYCMIARSDSGRLLGIAGFQTVNGAFAGGTAADLRAVYGRLGSIWRMGILRLLSHDGEDHRFLIDGICVISDAQGLGVGTALIAALAAEARSRGYPSIRLDVVDTNQRARALYERLGFIPLDTIHIGVLQHVFGFAAATTMVKPLA